MHLNAVRAAGLAALVSRAAATPCSSSAPGQKPITSIQLGPRPYWLVNDMESGTLKDKLLSCSEQAMRPSRFSIGHRGGGTLQIPEESVQSELAGARMGAGVLECDVTFSKLFSILFRG